MTPEASASDAFVYEAIKHAILARAPVDALAVAAGSPAEIAAGVAVYRNNIRAAYLRVLSDAFPVVERLVGPEFFRFLAHEYFHALPPSTPLVAHYGDALPAFIERFAPASDLPYLADVARIEIAWLDAYHAADARPLTPREIFDVIGASPDRARFSFHPSMRLLASPYPVHSIWRRNRECELAPTTLSPDGECVLIARPGETVLTQTLSGNAFDALSALSSGAALGEALNAATRENTPSLLSRIIEEIVAAGVIVAAATPVEPRKARKP